MATTRTALDAFGRSVAKEYGRRGIRCNTVVLDPLGLAPASASALDTILFLLSEDASFVNGDLLQVSGGFDR